MARPSGQYQSQCDKLCQVISSIANPWYYMRNYRLHKIMGVGNRQLQRYLNTLIKQGKIERQLTRAWGEKRHWYCIRYIKPVINGKKTYFWKPTYVHLTHRKNVENIPMNAKELEAQAERHRKEKLEKQIALEKRMEEQANILQAEMDAERKKHQEANRDHGWEIFRAENPHIPEAKLRPIYLAALKEYRLQNRKRGY